MMVTESVYPKYLDFGKLPAGVQSVPKWVHLCNYQTGAALDVEDWGINDHFISRRPLLQALNPANSNHIKTNAPASGNSRYILSHGDYVFEANSSSGLGVFVIDSAGSAEEVSRRAGITATANMHHDGRFLYVPTADGLFVIKIDPFGNLLIKDLIKPNAVTITGVSGYGDYVALVDSVGVTIVSTDHNGTITQVDSGTLANCVGVTCRDGEVYAIVTGTKKLHTYLIDAAGKLTAKDDYAFAVAPENITCDDDYIYVNLTSDALNSVTYDRNSDTLTVEDTVTLPWTTCYQLFFDGGYLNACLGPFIQSYSVDRANGTLAEMIRISTLSDELLVDGNMEAGPGVEKLVDGNMEAAGTGAYIVGNSATLTKESPGYSGSQCLRVAYNGVNYPYTIQIVFTIGRTYNITGWARGDGVKYPYINISGGMGTVWAGTSSTSWQAININVAPAGTNISLLVFTSAAGYAEFDDISIKETCPDWTPGNSAKLTKESPGYSGLQCLRVAYTSVNNPYARRDPTVATRVYHVTGWARGDGTRIPSIQDGSASFWTGVASSSWQFFNFTFTATGADLWFQTLAIGAGYTEWDDISVKEYESDIRNLWTDGEVVYTGEYGEGIGVYDYDESRQRFPVYYTPLGYGEHNGDMTVQGQVISLKGESPSDYDPYIIPNSDSITLKADTRWDKIAFDFFNNFDRVEDVKAANPLIPSEIKARSFVPRGTIVYRPLDSATEQSSIGAANWRRQ